MAEEQNRSRLGRGLAALIGEVNETVPPTAPDRGRGSRKIPTEFLRPNPRNPRRSFSDEDLDDLANSIREKGIIQPILVRPIAGLDGTFEIIAGERRWRAAQRAALHEVPIVVIEAADREAYEIAIIENVQRADLNPLEEALGYEKLAADYGYSQSDLARVIGKSRSHIANTMRLAKLPEKVQMLLASGDLSAGHARALLAVKDPEQIAHLILEHGLTVRDVERIAQEDAGITKKSSVSKKAEKDPDTRMLEKALEDILGLSVSIIHSARGGELRIKYRTLEQLDDVCLRLRD